MENKQFCQNVLSLIGQPYSQTDCIGVVRKAAGIRCQGTNWLWRSYTSKGKYQYLTQRLERPPRQHELKNGMLVFRIKWDQVPKGYTDRPNCHHVGVIVDGTVVQSNESTGVNRKPYIVDEWDGCGWLKFIDFPISSDRNGGTQMAAPLRGTAQLSSAAQYPDEENDISYNDVYTQPPRHSNGGTPTGYGPIIECGAILSDHDMIKAIYNHLIVD